MAPLGETPPLSPADHAAWLAAIAWGGRPWDRIAPSWRARLLAYPRAEAPSRPNARAALQDARHAHDNVEFQRIHPSWLVRALQAERPAVQCAVLSRLSSPLRDTLRDALVIPPDDLHPPHEPLPEALAVAESLWTERLVGGPDWLPDDPPVVQTLSTLKASSLSRLLGLCALAKRAYLQHDDGLPFLAPSAQHLLDALRPGWQHFQRDRLLESLARDDLGDEPAATARDLARDGLLTIGRLLAPVDPIRTRWTLQHLPYNVAKPIRAAVNAWPFGFDPNLLLAWEGRVLELARDMNTALADLEDDDSLGEDAP